MSGKFKTMAAVALALYGAGAGAEGLGDVLSVRGYGTLGVAHSSQDEGDYVRDFYSQPQGAGRTDELSTRLDSKAAVQLDAKFNDRFSAVVQVVSEAMYNNSWDSKPQKMWKPSLEWANLSYKVTDALTVRAGRVVMPFLMNAEFQKVGYANHWMRAPVELYGKVSYTSLDGADGWYKHSLGAGQNTVRIYGGMQNAEWADSQDTRVKMIGLIDTFETGDLTLRAAYQYTKVRGAGPEAAAPLRQLAGGLSFLSAAAAEQANDIADVMDDGFKVKFATVGASYDVGNWFVMGEVWNQRGSTLIPKHTSAYVSGGIRTGKWTPYATIAKTKVKDFADRIPTAGLPTTGPFAAVVLGAEAVNQGFEETISYTQSTISIGTRWDVYTNIAIKAQYDYVMLPSDSYGMFVNRSADFKAGKDASVIGLSIDFVF